MEQTIKTYKHACKALGIDPNNVPDVKALPKVHQKAITAHYKLVIIAQALNAGWVPDFTNWDEYKYYPWFEIKKDKKSPSGFGFSHSFCDYSHPGYACRLAPLLQNERTGTVRGSAIYRPV